MRSEPMRSEPMRSEPMRSEPMRSEPMRSEPAWSEPADVSEVSRWAQSQGAIEVPRETATQALMPWAWATNGALSVVASVLAALLALSVGFSWVLISGAGCYALAWLVSVSAWPPENAPPDPRTRSRIGD